MQRNQTLVLVVLLVLALGAGISGWFAYSHLKEMKAEIGELRGNVAGLQGNLADAEEQVVAERSRANDAEERAGTAEDLALRLGEHAEAAEEETERALRAANQEAAARMVAELNRTEANQQREQALLTSMQAQQDADEARSRLQEIEEQRQRDLDRLQRTLGKIAETRRTAIGMVMNLGNAIEFDFNKAELRPQNRELLSRIAGVLMTAEDFGIQVYGHTDDVGSVEYNRELSQRRAEAVRKYLIEAGVDPDVIQSKGFGKGAPLVEGTDDDARQRNRRVEIAVVQTTGAGGVMVEPSEDGPDADRR